MEHIKARSNTREQPLSYRHVRSSYSTKRFSLAPISSPKPFGLHRRRVGILVINAWPSCYLQNAPLKLHLPIGHLCFKPYWYAKPVKGNIWAFLKFPSLIPHSPTAPRRQVCCWSTKILRASWSHTQLSHCFPPLRCGRHPCVARLSFDPSANPVFHPPPRSQSGFEASPVNKAGKPYKKRRGLCVYARTEIRRKKPSRPSRCSWILCARAGEVHIRREALARAFRE